jgi:hypothetical protein
MSDVRDEHNSVVVDEVARLIKSGERQVVRRALMRWPPAHQPGCFITRYSRHCPRGFALLWASPRAMTETPRGLNGGNAERQRA